MHSADNKRACVLRAPLFCAVVQLVLINAPAGYCCPRCCSRSLSLLLLDACNDDVAALASLLPVVQCISVWVSQHDSLRVMQSGSVRLSSVCLCNGTTDLVQVCFITGVVVGAANPTLSGQLVGCLHT
jgi:hypothetical protein